MGDEETMAPMADPTVPSIRDREPVSNLTAEATAADVLRRIADETIRAIEPASSTETALLDTLGRHVARLDEATFQVAVLGQFKRGKSTLINALIGQRLLTTDVLPVTAIPTFLAASDAFGITTVTYGGERSSRAAPDFYALSELAAAATTETGNPRNALELDHVLITLPAKGLLECLTLVDTPGIGSTHRHNTEAAHGVLPECDAALFVLSVDPPITDVELDYLEIVCGVVKTVILVMNKVDVVQEAEIARLVSFVGIVVSERGGVLVDPKIFSLSARTALEARLSDDEGALARSGLLTLEAYVRDRLVAGKTALLADSIGRKMLAVLDRLRAEATLRKQALVALDAKIEALRRAEAAFGREREHLHDRLQGEWRRSLAKLKELCSEADRTVGTGTAPLLADEASRVECLDDQVEIFFDEAFAHVVDTIDASVARAVTDHQSRYDELVSQVHEMSSSIMELPSAGSIVAGPLVTTRKPYWSGRLEADSLGSLTMDGLSRLLPRAVRMRRQARKRRKAVERALVKNLTALHWSAKQSIDDTFRQLLATVASSVDASLRSTADLVIAIRERRLAVDETASLEAEIYAERSRTLDALSARIAAVLGEPG